MEQTLTILPEMTAEQKQNIDRVVNDYSRRLLGFIRKRVNNEADAEDILQDVFYQFIGNTQPIEQLTAWLFTVARNKITDRYRKKQTLSLEDLYSREEESVAFDWAEIFFDESDNPETEYLRSIFWEALDNALNELPPAQRGVFVMNEMEGIPFKEIADQTGESINTLLSRKRYAVLHLRDRLEVLRNELLNY